LRAHVAWFETLRSSGQFQREVVLLEAANARREECTGTFPGGGFPALYSDLGYILLGEALQLVAGEPLGNVVERELRAAHVNELATAEHFGAALDTFGVPTEDSEWRGSSLLGEVHDDNAFMLSGKGMSGHAGLFGTASAVLRFGCVMLDAYHGHETHLSRSSAEHLLRKRPGHTLRAGFDGKSVHSSSIGERLGAETFGHLGFTGTSFWCDPEADMVVVLLSNRVCPTRDNPRLAPVRPLLHDLLATTAQKMASE
jgi:CubicO group peptidase (beta-lactamase class C family)